MIRITTHSDPLNMRASFTLNGVEDYGKDALIELFRSNAPFDRNTRDAFADALARKKGRRLELIKDKPNRPLVARLSTWYEYQQIADEVAEYIAGGDPAKAAKSKVMERRRISLDKVKVALRYRRKHPGFRISRAER
jgi:hypothetical protein